MGTVKYLLDTHTLLWAARDNAKLGNNAVAIIEDINTTLFVSEVKKMFVDIKNEKEYILWALKLITAGVMRNSRNRRRR